MLFRLKNPAPLAQKRGQLGFTLDGVPNLSSSTVWRIENDRERGHVKKKLEAYLAAIQADIPFEEACEAVTRRSADACNWSRLQLAAEEIGDYLFNDFRANIVLTFSGHSWVFASLVLAVALDRDRLLSTPVYVAMVMDWAPTSPMPRRPGFTPLPGWLPPDKTSKRYGFVVLMPDAFPKADRRGERRVAVIDDSITSGVVPPVVAKHLQRLGYRENPDAKEGTFKIVCCVYHDSPGIVKKPDYFVIPSKGETFHFPWDDSIWFPRR